MIICAAVRDCDYTTIRLYERWSSSRRRNTLSC